MTKDKLKNKEIGIEKERDILEKQAKNLNIFLGLGSNLISKFGDRIKNLEFAQQLLIENNIKIIKRSNYYESLSFPNKKDPKFINCVLIVNSNLKPLKLMDILIKIEKKIGRIRNKKNEPRVCDIDIIDYRGEIIEQFYYDKKLTIPHKDIHKRNFVLIPLMELEPSWIHPVSNLLISDLVSNLSDTEIKSITKIYIK